MNRNWRGIMNSPGTSYEPWALMIVYEPGLLHIKGYEPTAIDFHEPIELTHPVYRACY